MTGPGSQEPVEGAADDHAGTGTAELPEPVRVRLAGWAGAALAVLPPDLVGGELRRVLRFAPAKRAKLAGSVILRALDAQPALRAAVAGTVAEPPLGPDGAPGEPAVPLLVDRAAYGFLVTAPDLADRLAELGAAVDAHDRTAREAALTTALHRAESRIAELEGELDRLRDRAGKAPADADELDKLRRRLRERGVQHREQELQLARATTEHERVVAELTGRVRELESALTTWRHRAEQAVARAEAAQQAADAARAADRHRRGVDDRRVELLLETVAGAVAGLRREWRVASGGSDPADQVAARLPSPVDARTTSEPGRLAEWLALPNAHLVVDGYNVTKTAFPELALADQRERLVRLLGALVARTGADATVVFDGAAVSAPPPLTRRVRVLFSPPGTIADAVIADLVEAEPRGRVLVVASSDREVVTHAHRRGARSVPSAVLARLLAPAP